MSTASLHYGIRAAPRAERGHRRAGRWCAGLLIGVALLFLALFLVLPLAAVFAQAFEQGRGGVLGSACAIPTRWPRSG